MHILTKAYATPLPSKTAVKTWCNLLNFIVTDIWKNPSEEWNDRIPNWNLFHFWNAPLWNNVLISWKYSFERYMNCVCNTCVWTHNFTRVARMCDREKFVKSVILRATSLHLFVWCSYYFIHIHTSNKVRKTLIIDASSCWQYSQYRVRDFSLSFE